MGGLPDGAGQTRTRCASSTPARIVMREEPDKDVWRDAGGTALLPVVHAWPDGHGRRRATGVPPVAGIAEVAMAQGIWPEHIGDPTSKARVRGRAYNPTGCQSHRH